MAKGGLHLLFSPSSSAHCLPVYSLNPGGHSLEQAQFLLYKSGLFNSLSAWNMPNNSFKPTPLRGAA